MRLSILNHLYPVRTRMLFALIRFFSRQPVPDAAKIVAYRPEFYGAIKLTHEAMRGPSAWSLGDRELMAAVVAQANACEFCVRAHSAVAERAYRDEARVAATLDDLETAPIAEPLRATLRLLRTLAREHAVDADDMRAVLVTGVSRQQIEDALAVSFAFNTTVRLADAFGFSMLSPQGLASGATYLFARGYR